MTRQNGAIPSPSNTARPPCANFQGFGKFVQTSKGDARPRNALKSAIRIGYCPSVPETCSHTVQHVRGFASFYVKKRNFKRMNKGCEAPESYLISGSGHCNLVHSNIRKIYNNFPIKPTFFYLPPCAMVMFS
jgi:hypothetical protein